MQSSCVWRLFLTDQESLDMKMKKRDLELYLHLPFCVRKCNYCDFFSAAGSEEEQEAYVQAMVQEIRQYQKTFQLYEVKTVFLGGGTPSLLSERQAEQIFQALYDAFEIDRDAEITMEMNPGTVNLEKLKKYKKIGVNRLSIGLQSAQNHELKMLGRIHTYEDFLETWKEVEQAGFENRNIDLMSALPGQKLKTWEDTLKKVLALQPEHISAYSLILEEGTPFYNWYEAGRFESGDWELPSEEEEYRMGERTIEILQAAGMHRYEISNYAKPGKECRHNLGYWERTEYLGIGAGASSLIGEKRFNHIRNRKEYIEMIRRGESVETEQERLSITSRMEEFMYLGLRKTEGISRTAFRNCFRKSLEEVYGTVIEKLSDEKLIECDGDKVRLSHRGMDVSNCVLAEFLF